MSRARDFADALGQFTAIFVPGAGGNVVEGTTYELSSDDHMSTAYFTSDSAVTVTVPADLPVAFDWSWVQCGDGQITFAAGSGATLNSPEDPAHMKSRARGSRGAVTVSANADDESAVAWLNGDTAV